MISRLPQHLKLITAWRNTAGFGPAVSWELSKLGGKLGFTRQHWIVRPRQVDHALSVRLGGSSDFDIFHQIFVANECDAIANIEGVETVIDLGANVGYMSAFCLSRYPRCRVLAVEPDGPNCEQAARNVAPYGSRAQLLQGAVWSSNSTLSLHPGDGLDWGRQVREKTAGDHLPSVESFDMPTLIDRFGSASVDLLKIDVEGAELEMFRYGAERWLGRVRNICIELHTQDCRRAFFQAMDGFDFDMKPAGSCIVCRNIRSRCLGGSAQGLQAVGSPKGASSREQ